MSAPLRIFGKIKIEKRNISNIIGFSFGRDVGSIMGTGMERATCLEKKKKKKKKETNKILITKIKSIFNPKSFILKKKKYDNHNI
jgi:hypothetical protein